MGKNIILGGNAISSTNDCNHNNNNDPAQARVAWSRRQRYKLRMAVPITKYEV